MHINSPTIPPAESYPTFWNEASSTQTPPIIPAEDAYDAFVNMSEEGLPLDSPQVIDADVD